MHFLHAVITLISMFVGAYQKLRSFSNSQGVITVATEPNLAPDTGLLTPEGSSETKNVMSLCWSAVSVNAMSEFGR